MSHFTCHMVCVMCNMSFFFVDKVVKLIGGGSVKCFNVLIFAIYFTELDWFLMFMIPNQPQTCVSLVQISPRSQPDLDPTSLLHPGKKGECLTRHCAPRLPPGMDWIPAPRDPLCCHHQLLLLLSREVSPSPPASSCWRRRSLLHLLPPPALHYTGLSTPGSAATTDGRHCTTVEASPLEIA